MVNRNSVKIIVLLMMSLTVLTACKSDEDLIGSELMMVDENEFVSSEVKMGDLKETVTKDAESYYPITADLTPSSSGLVLVEVKVDNLEFVHKGDLLAEIRPYNDEEIAAKEKAITDKETELSTMLAYYDSEKSQLNAALAAAANSTEKSIYENKLELNELNRNYINDNSLAEIETLKAELAVMKEDKGDCNIYAPFDGIISSVYIAQEGAVLTSSSVVFSMYSSDTVVVYFEDPGYVYCDNEVLVTAGNGDKKQEIKGTVVCADHYLNPSIAQGKVFVRLEGEYDKENLDNLKVTVTGYEVKDVLITKSTGINRIKDKDYVYIMEDDKLKRRHVITGGSDGENTWILQGIEEGDVVYLQ